MSSEAKNTCPFTHIVYAARDLAPAVLEHKGLHLDQGFLFEISADEEPIDLLKRMGPGGKAIKAFVYVDVPKAVQSMAQGGGNLTFKAMKKIPGQKIKRIQCSKQLIGPKFCLKMYLRESTNTKQFREVIVNE